MVSHANTLCASLHCRVVPVLRRLRGGSPAPPVCLSCHSRASRLWSVLHLLSPGIHAGVRQAVRVVSSIHRDWRAVARVYRGWHHWGVASGYGYTVRGQALQKQWRVVSRANHLTRRCSEPLTAPRSSPR
jgi:hypothetical protein